MFDMKMLAMLAQLLLIAGALNWGLVAYNGMDLVNMATGGGMMEQAVKYLVAAAGLFALYDMLM